MLRQCEYCAPLPSCDMQKIQNLGFLRPKDLEKVRVNSLINLVANTRLGLVP